MFAKTKKAKKVVLRPRQTEIECASFSYKQTWSEPAADGTRLLSPGELLINGKPVSMASSLKFEIDAVDMIPKITLVIGGFKPPKRKKGS